MSEPVTTIRNIGPATAEGFARAGITTAAELRALGPDGAYRRWLAAGNGAHFIGYYVLVMALQGRPWNDCRGEEKKALRRRFDALVAEAAQEKVLTGPSHSEIDRALDLIGVGPRR